MTTNCATLRLLFLDKCYQREEGIRNPFFLAPNYQMTEMQGAVALAQLERLDDSYGTALENGDAAFGATGGHRGYRAAAHRPGSKHSYFMFLLSSTSRNSAAALTSLRQLCGTKVSTPKLI